MDERGHAEEGGHTKTAHDTTRRRECRFRCASALNTLHFAMLFLCSSSYVVDCAHLPKGGLQLISLVCVLFPMPVSLSPNMSTAPAKKGDEQPQKDGKGDKSGAGGGHKNGAGVGKNGAGGKKKKPASSSEDDEIDDSVMCSLQCSNSCKEFAKRSRVKSDPWVCGPCKKKDAKDEADAIADEEPSPRNGEEDDGY